MNGIQSNLIDSLYQFIGEGGWNDVTAKDCIRTSAGDAAVSFITETTSPQEFDTFCASLEGYEPEHGGHRTALREAAIQCNLPLFQHLINEQVLKQGKTHLLDLGSKPILVCAAEGYYEDSDFEISKLCIQAGAKVNLVAMPIFNYGKNTPLDTAARHCSLSLINMLIVNGGLIYRPSFSTGLSCTVERALTLLFNRVKPLFIAKQDETHFNIFPVKELFNEVIRGNIWVLAHTYLETPSRKVDRSIVTYEDEPCSSSWGITSVLRGLAERIGL